MPTKLIPFGQGKGKEGCFLTLLRCISVLREYFLQLFFLLLFYCQVVFTPDPWSERDISSGLMILLPVPA